MCESPPSYRQQAAPMDEGEGPEGDINFDDCPSRAERLIRALKLVPLRELWGYLNNLEEADHLFACDAKCHIGPTPYGGCSHPKKTFLSTRNSRRSTHVYLFWFFLFGNPSRITDNMLKGDMRKNLRPVCPYGLNECNGHARNPGHQVCINPFHYQVVEPQLIVEKLVQHGVLSFSFPLKTRLVTVRSFCSDLRGALAAVSHDTEAFQLPADDTASETGQSGVVPAIAAMSNSSPRGTPVSSGTVYGPATMSPRTLLRSMPKRHTTVLPSPPPLAHAHAHTHVHSHASMSTPPPPPVSIAAPHPLTHPQFYHLMQDPKQYENWAYPAPPLQPMYMSSPFAAPRAAVLTYPCQLSSLHRVLENEAIVPSDDDTTIDDTDAQEMASILMSIGTRRTAKRTRTASERRSRSSSSCGLQALASAAAAADVRHP